ncbi:hypothetical protein NEOLEDRAFT_948642 [Neolentinus lepideus HHB14362 ss-1]|uniref:DUF7082 domain-containing protein n=1 Tax=Neolentinus lepideus HHB14362 ss-1 TaxID=1314782 RepID=A0A165UDA0_9AGAM|nr:hypothetical protein NEOLEDRAFT_948642 [Neolentinus lepideus HHB14362 ss-1]
MPPYRTGSNPGSAMADVTLRVQLGASYIAPPRQQSSLPLASVNYPDRTIQALDYSPKFGLSGGMIRARVLYMRPVTHDICLRLVFGTRPVRTKCQNVGNVNYELSALIPELNCPMERVVVLVQALTITNEVLDTCALGTFTYGDQNTSDASAATLSRQRTEEDGYSGVDKATSQATVARYTNESACTSIDPSVVNMQTPVPPSDKAPSARRAQLRRGRSTSTSASSNSKVQSLMRTRPAAIAPCISKKAVLETLTSFDTMVEDWRDDEKEVGRRLIRFQVQRQEHILKVSCERIEQSEYDERDIVVSCIHRTESGICYITSVDIIYLLERIVGTVFKVEEKNRIRRNLEGLKPITTGKGKRWCQDFFQKIMSFPNPKPRTIEKDLKVFEWRVLGQALEKIISRYVSTVHLSFIMAWTDRSNTVAL